MTRLIIIRHCETEDQKIDAPPHLKRCGLIGARFLDAQRVDHSPKAVVSGRHVDIINLGKSKDFTMILI